MTNRKLTMWVVAVLVTVTASIRPSAYGGGEPFLGEILWVPYNFAPLGYMSCDGQLLSIAQNTALFALLGTTYGGDGQTTFALPDVRGRTSVHVGQGPGLSNYDLGEVMGVENLTLTTNQLPSHTHTISPPAHTHVIPPLPVTVMASAASATGAIPNGQVLAMGRLGFGRGLSNVTHFYNAGPANVAMGTSGTTQSDVSGNASVSATDPAGGSQPHENRQPYLVLRCIIAIEGIFPSQNGKEN